MPAPTDRLLSAGYRRLARPVLFRLDAERSHHGMLRALELAGGSAAGRAALGGRARPPVGDPVELAGLRFANRVGLAAGVDKDGRALAAWPALGLGHVELGTVTARPQPGNPVPRMFRLAASEAVINRMGFNNAGAGALADRLRAVGPQPGLVVGVSIGKSKVVPVEEATEDYLASARALDGLADYLAVNVSSPNTPGLRTLQDRGPLEELLCALTGELAVLARARGGVPPPVLVKIAPDLTEAALEEVLEVAVATGVQGLVATNTTLARDGLAAADLPLAQEAGGLSGAPLARRARQVVGFLARRGPLPVIGVGGVMSLADGQALLDAGARLVQVYTGLVYRGPQLVRELAEGLGEQVER